MALRGHFPATAWLARAFTGRIARRIYLAIVALIFTASAVARVRAFVLTRKMHAVIQGVSKLRIDETSEDEVLRTVPYLVRGDWSRQVQRTAETGDVDEGIEHAYFVKISNARDWLAFANFAGRFSRMEITRDGFPKSWICSVADLLGYRYVGFTATVIVLNGKVSSAGYGIANVLVFPEPLGLALSVKSIHGIWGPYRSAFRTSSTSDEAREFDVSGDDAHLRLRFASEASPQLISHAYQVNLSCFWSLLGCRHAQQIAPLLWQDKRAIDTATLARLKSSDPCPDRILAGRVKYLPDVVVSLLESNGSKHTSVDEEGHRDDEISTDYKIVEDLRGRSSGPWDSVRSRTTVPYPGDDSHTLPNPGLRWTKPGDKVLAFSSLGFDSCGFVLATPSALAAIRDAVPAPRRLEDELVGSLH
ncbi:MAG: hypothetical protein WB995_04500 [Candidatus Acidiferrales bacterium]